MVITGQALLELLHLIYPRLLTGFDMLFFFTNLILMESQVRYLALFLLLPVIGVVLDGKSSQECPGNAGVPQGSILVFAFFLLYTNDLLDDVICNVTIYADDTTLYSKSYQASDLWN